MYSTSSHLPDCTVALVGGDRRMLHAAHRLSEVGAHIVTLGLGDAHEFRTAHDFSDAARDACALLLPLPATRDGRHVNCPLAPDCLITFCDISTLMRERKDLFLCGGMLPRAFLDTVDPHRVSDYYEDEALLLRNAYLTAEGALSLAMEQTDYALQGSTAAVIGYGRIGKLLARLLLSVGMRVTVCARRREARLWAEADDCRAQTMSDLPLVCRDHPLIFNTVPEQVLTRDLLMCTAPDTLIIDLASAPFGAHERDAAEAARTNRLCYMRASGIPGRYAPRDAGYAIADRVSEVLMQFPVISAKGETDP